MGHRGRSGKRGRESEQLSVRARDALSKLLDPAEREAVFGDFAELALTDRRAVKSLVGLVLRRQLRLWTEWNPWFACLLSSFRSAHFWREYLRANIGIWPSLWMNLHHGASYRTGLSTGALLADLCFQGAALVTWSWTSGFALGTLSRRTIWVSGALFFGLYINLASDGWLFSGGFSWLTGWAWLPFLINLLFVLFPAYCGIRQSSKCQNITSARMITIGSVDNDDGRPCALDARLGSSRLGQLESRWLRADPIATGSRRRRVESRDRPSARYCTIDQPHLLCVCADCVHPHAQPK